MSSPSEIVEFLRARLEEDEERARFVQREQGDRSRFETEPWRLSWHDEYDLLCIEPSRALAEVEAKRETIRLYEESVAFIEMMKGHGQEAPAHVGAAESYLNVIRNDAAVYADHPDYDQAWRP